MEQPIVVKATCNEKSEKVAHLPNGQDLPICITEFVRTGLLDASGQPEIRLQVISKNSLGVALGDEVQVTIQAPPQIVLAAGMPTKAG